jgi:Flp pilus assembly protein TadG
VKNFHHSIKKFFAKSDGAATVEFVLLLPLFVGILIGGFDLGRYVFLQNELTSAVQDAGRFAMINGSSSRAPATASQIRSFAQQRIVFNDVDNVVISVTFSPDNRPGSTVLVRADASFTALAGLLQLSNLTLTARSSNVIVN